MELISKQESVFLVYCIYGNKGKITSASNRCTKMKNTLLL